MNTADVAIVILNYNKKEYVLKCIDSVKNLNFKDYDLYVVDNGSTDGSADAIKNYFGIEVNLIINKKNIGGSGGFNIGIEEALKKDYKYIYLLDNDVILNRDSLGELYNYMEENRDVGLAGSLIYSMDSPKEIQESGSYIDWDRFYVSPNYKGYIDDGQIPDVIECDYIPACSALIKRKVIDKIGLMDASNFIYWDDIEWAYRIRSMGYKVVAWNKSKVWHKMGAASERRNTFGTYYFWRNRIYFFIKYLDKEKIEKFCKKLFEEVFEAVYSCNYIGKYSSAKTILNALDDACNNKGGKRIMVKYMKLKR